jgi:hypothetical protein
MVATWSAFIPALGGVVAALGGVIVGGRLTARSQHSSWLRDCQLKATAEALDVYSSIYEKMDLWCTKAEEPNVDWAAWQSVLNKLSLTASPAVARAAFELDGQLWRVDEEVKAGHTGIAAWHEMRMELESLQLVLVNAARAQLNTQLPTLESVIGRPDQSDEMWTSWRSRHSGTQEM